MNDYMADTKNDVIDVIRKYELLGAVFGMMKSLASIACDKAMAKQLSSRSVRRIERMEEEIERTCNRIAEEMYKEAPGEWFPYFPVFYTDPEIEEEKASELSAHMKCVMRETMDRIFRGEL